MKLRLLCALLACTLLASACGPTEQVAATAEPSPSPRPSPSPSPDPPVLCPLTGAEAPEGVDLDRPVLGIKIDNASRAKPQAGLESADVVYEELVEGGITRFLAIFHCRDAERLGPTRSARMVDPDLLQQYSPVLFAFSGANDTVLGKVAATPGLIDLQHGKLGSAYFRQSGRPAPHNLFTSTGAIRQAQAAQGVAGGARSGFVFDGGLLDPDRDRAAGDPDGESAVGAGRRLAPASPASPEPEPQPSASPAGASPAAADPAPAAPGAEPTGDQVAFSYSSGGQTVEFRYDPAARAYVRRVGGTPHNSEAGAALQAVNVLVLKVRVTPGLVISAGGARSPDIAVTGEGEAVVLRGGEAVTGRWQRSGLTDQIRLVDASGGTIELAPGNIWINLLPSDRPVILETAGESPAPAATPSP